MPASSEEAASPHHDRHRYRQRHAAHAASRQQLRWGRTTRSQTYLTPFWAKLKPFALTSASQFRPPGAYTYLGPDGKPSGKYVDEIDKMTQYSKQLADTRTTMAEYWEDGPGSGTPPGHWNTFAQWVARRDANTVDQDAKLFFALNNAVLDTSICAWDGKGRWDSIRPISAVRWLQRGKIIQAWDGPYKGPSYIKGQDWIPIGPPATRPRRSPSTPRATPPSAWPPPRS
jgi:hypothetical protein